MGFFGKLLGKDSARKPAHKSQPPSGTAYVLWSCLDDVSSCDNCRSLDGTGWIPAVADISEPPLHSCQSPKGCRCVHVYVSITEAGASDVAEFIRASGGKATKDELAEYDESKRAPLRKISERQNLAATKTSEAHKVEKDNPEKAITLYQESIAIERELAERSPDPWSWRNFPYLYNRLTLVLESLGRHDEALLNITEYEGFPCQDQGTKSDRDAIEKRKIRLTKKLQSASAGM